MVDTEDVEDEDHHFEEEPSYYYIPTTITN